jgi:hypothetical protein
MQRGMVMIDERRSGKDLEGNGTIPEEDLKDCVILQPEQPVSGLRF